MLSYQFLTLALAAATAATSPSKPASLGGANTEGIIPYEDYEAAIPSAGADGVRTLTEERLCDLTLCLGIDLTGECTRWCYYRNRPQRVPVKQRLHALSARFGTATECWFYNAPTCDMVFLMHGPVHKMVRPGGNLEDHVKGQIGCVRCIV